MADSFEYNIDSRNKLGGDVDWMDSDEFSTFVDALNRGVTLRANSVEGVAELPRENVLDAAALAELKSRLAGYQ